MIGIGRRLLLGRGFGAGVIAGLAMVAVMFLVRWWTGIPSLTELVEGRGALLIPIPIFEFFIQSIGGLAKRLFFLGLLAGQIATLGVIGAGYGYLLSNPVLSSRKWLLAIAGSLLLWFFTIAGLMPLLGAGFFGSELQAGAWESSISALPVFLSYGAALVISYDWLGTLYPVFYSTIKEDGIYAAPQTKAAPEAVDAGRRNLIRMVAVGMVALVAGGFAFRFLVEAASKAQTVVKKIAGLTPEITPNKDFYVVSKNFLDPVIDDSKWKLEVKGMVEDPFALTYDELKALPSVTELATLICISNPVGGDLISNAEWRGVRLRDLLEKAGVKPDVKDVVFYAWDDYSDSIPLEKAMHPDTLVAWEMNGEPLPSEHGFPARLIVPGIYGEKNVKWVTTIELVDYDYKGYWQKGGWSDIATINTTSRIDTPELRDVVLTSQPTTIAGIAFAGDRGVAGVEVSTDDGATWEEAIIKDALSPYTWVLWMKDWRPPKAGRYFIQVRAKDKTGQIQTAEVRDSFPDGATGLHMVAVDVSE